MSATFPSVVKRWVVCCLYQSSTLPLAHRFKMTNDLYGVLLYLIDTLQCSFSFACWLHLTQSITFFIWNLVNSWLLGLHTLLIFLLMMEILSPSLMAGSFLSAWPSTWEHTGLLCFVLYLFLSSLTLLSLMALTMSCLCWQIYTVMPHFIAF